MAWFRPMGGDRNESQVSFSAWGLDWPSSKLVGAAVEPQPPAANFQGWKAVGT